MVVVIAMVAVALMICYGYHDGRSRLWLWLWQVLVMAVSYCLTELIKQHLGPGLNMGSALGHACIANGMHLKCEIATMNDSTKRAQQPQRSQQYLKLCQWRYQRGQTFFQKTTKTIQG